jgi:hypothetical protein
LVPALHGTAVHLPLSAEETLNNTFGSLPSNSSLEILVDSVPTKRKIVWRDLVNLKKVYAALQMLKQINPTIYGDISIDLNNIDPNLAVDTIEIPALESEPLLEPQSPYLLPADRTDQHAYAHFTILPMQRNLPSETNIELYKMQRVQGKPLRDTEQDLDLKCFPVLFPKGHFGMDAQRPRKVTKAMFVRSRLRIVDPRFRRNKQYLFHALHMADVRALNSGIFAMLKTSNVSGITASK